MDHVTRADLVAYCTVTVADMRQATSSLDQRIRAVRRAGQASADDYAAVAEAAQMSLYAVSNLALMLASYLEGR